MRVALSQPCREPRRRPLGQAHSHGEPASAGDESLSEAPRAGVAHPVPTADSAKSLMLRWGVMFCECHLQKSVKTATS